MVFCIQVRWSVWMAVGFCYVKPRLMWWSRDSQYLDWVLLKECDTVWTLCYVKPWLMWWSRDSQYLDLVLLNECDTVWTLCYVKPWLMWWSRDSQYLDLVLLKECDTVWTLCYVKPWLMWWSRDSQYLDLVLLNECDTAWTVMPILAVDCDNVKSTTHNRFASDSVVFLRHCALYKFTYLLVLVFDMVECLRYQVHSH